MATAVTAPEGQHASLSRVRQVSGVAFEGLEPAGGSAIEPDAVKAGGGGTGDGGNSSGNGGGDFSGGGSNGSDNSNDFPLDKIYPKVVIILDTFKGPASETTIDYIEKLADLGVHVVFVTSRPEKGENSAESILVGRLRHRAGNPVMVVSYNGARISAHKAARSENPKPVVNDSEGFAQPTLELFSALNGAAKTRFKLAAEPVEASATVGENTYIYGVEIQLSKRLAKGKRTDVIKEVVKFYNDRVAAADLKYRFEGADGADGKIVLYTQSTALRLNTGRIFSAIRAQYPDLRDRLKQEDILFLADSTRAARFLSTLPGKDVIGGQGYWVHGVTDEVELQQGLFAVLHGKGLDDVKVTRNQLRTYVDWLASRQRYGGPRVGGGFKMGDSLVRYQREVRFYRGIIVYHLMGELYHRIRNHNFDGASLAAALGTLDEMWRNPKAFGISINEEIEGMRGTKRWKAFERESKGVVRQWLMNYYDRNFKDYPKGLSEQVVGTMINLARDSGNGIKLSYESPMTQRRYQVGVLPARGQIEKDENGDYILVVHAYRTGKEIRQDDFDESLEVNLSQRAMLQGYAKKEADGRWTVNGRPVRVMAIFHTMTRDIPSDIMTPEQIEGRSGEVTALIEKMQADKEFLAYWQAEQAKNEKATIGAAKKRAHQTARPLKRGKKKSSR